MGLERVIFFTRSSSHHADERYIYRSVGISAKFEYDKYLSLSHSVYIYIRLLMPKAFLQWEAQ